MKTLLFLFVITVATSTIANDAVTPILDGSLKFNTERYIEYAKSKSSKEKGLAFGKIDSVIRDIMQSRDSDLALKKMAQKFKSKINQNMELGRKDFDDIMELYIKLEYQVKTSHEESELNLCRQELATYKAQSQGPGASTSSRNISKTHYGAEPLKKGTASLH